VGQIVRGKITKLVNFGAFARIGETGVEGLIHISELSDRRVTHPKEVVAEGEEYDLRLIRIETDKRRLGLSLKQALPPSSEPGNGLDWQIAPTDENAEVAEVAAEATEAVEAVVEEAEAELA
jgi:small subunit ribosomal protein S1